MKRIFAIIIDTVWLAGLYFGLVHEVQGAMNIGLFLTWFMFLMSFGSLIPEVGNKIGEIPAWAIARSMSFDVVAIALLAWRGWMLTAAAVAWTAFAGFGAWAKNRKEQCA